MSLKTRLDKLEAPLLERSRRILCAFRLCEEVEVMLGELERRALCRHLRKSRSVHAYRAGRAARGAAKLSAPHRTRERHDTLCRYGNG